MIQPYYRECKTEYNNNKCHLHVTGVWSQNMKLASDHKTPSACSNRPSHIHILIVLTGSGCLFHLQELKRFLWPFLSHRNSEITCHFLVALQVASWERKQEHEALHRNHGCSLAFLAQLRSQRSHGSLFETAVFVIKELTAAAARH